ncbi:hypothetical protein N9L12_03235 [Luminiphilus sp.]|nr:hypothetical protein [Luminiphilus sp.]
MRGSIKGTSHQFTEERKTKRVLAAVFPLAIAIASPALSEAVFEGARDTEFLVNVNFSSANLFSLWEKDPFTGEVSYDDFEGICYSEVTDSYLGVEDITYDGMHSMFFELVIEFKDGHVVRSQISDIMGAMYSDSAVIKTGDSVGLMGSELRSRHPVDSDLDEIISTVLFRCNHENIEEVTFRPKGTMAGKLKTRSGKIIDRREFVRRAKVTVSGKAEVVNLIGNFPNSD